MCALGGTDCLSQDVLRHCSARRGHLGLLSLFFSSDCQLGFRGARAHEAWQSAGTFAFTAWRCSEPAASRPGKVPGGSRTAGIFGCARSFWAAASSPRAPRRPCVGGNLSEREAVLCKPPPLLGSRRPRGSLGAAKREPENIPTRSFHFLLSHPRQKPAEPAWRWQDWKQD